MMSITILMTMVMLLLFSSCGKEKKNVAASIVERDSMAFMSTKDVVTLISDSGITRYRMTTKQWDMYDRRSPSYWAFEKGIYLEQFDSLFHIEASVKSDTAYYYDKKRLWKLVGNVDIKNRQGKRFLSSLFYWNEATGRIYSDSLVHIIEPGQRDIYAMGFNSNQQMTEYVFRTASGKLYFEDQAKNPSTLQQDSTAKQ